MPLIDYDLHPVALAFGIFCFLLAAGLLTSIIYLGTRPSEAPPSFEISDVDPADVEPFVPEPPSVPTTDEDVRQIEDGRQMPA